MSATRDDGTECWCDHGITCDYHVDRAVAAARAEGRRETLAEAARWFEAEGYGYASTLLSALSAPATTVGEEPRCKYESEHGPGVYCVMCFPVAAPPSPPKGGSRLPPGVVELSPGVYCVPEARSVFAERSRSESADCPCGLSQPPGKDGGR